MLALLKFLVKNRTLLSSTKLDIYFLLKKRNLLASTELDIYFLFKKRKLGDFVGQLRVETLKIIV
jgi:hypothetical protein